MLTKKFPHACVLEAEKNKQQDEQVFQAGARTESSHNYQPLFSTSINPQEFVEMAGQFEYKDYRCRNDKFPILNILNL